MNRAKRLHALAAALTVAALPMPSALAQDRTLPPEPAVEALNQHGDQTEATRLYREAMASEVGKQLENLLSNPLMDPRFQWVEVRRIVASSPGTEANSTIGALEGAATLGLPDARRALGLWVAAGVRDEPDAEAGLKLITQAAEQGDARAQCLLGVAFNGTWSSIEPDHPRAFEWLHRAATSGHATSQFLLGNAYREGRGTQVNVEEALRWWKLAADQGVPGAQLAFALVLEKGGSDAPKNITEIAASYARMAAESGYAEAQFHLGRMQLTGHELVRDPTEAVQWLESAATLDSEDAMLLLASHYYIGEILERDEQKAVDWFLKAAQPRSGFDAQFHESLRDIDRELASRYLHRYGGNAQAQYLVAHQYLRGDVLPKSDTDAFKWMKSAAQRGHEAAQCDFAWMYYEGIGVPQDYKEAVRWFGIAAERGNTQAQYGLGLCYAHGDGVRQDLVAAHKWLNLAGAGGHGEAREARDRISQRMTREQIAEAQQLAAEFVASGSSTESK